VEKALNCSYNITRSYTIYPVKSLLDPNVPNNEGCLKPIKVLAQKEAYLTPDGQQQHLEERDYPFYGGVSYEDYFADVPRARDCALWINVSALSFNKR